MTIQLKDLKGCPLERQCFTWRDRVQAPISKLDVDAFTRVAVILLNGVEMEAIPVSASRPATTATTRKISAHPIMVPGTHPAPFGCPPSSRGRAT
jgi:hypothetical protein